MSFITRLDQPEVVAAVNPRAESISVLRSNQPVAATPAGVAVGSALVAAAWTGAQVGDVAD